MNVNRGVGASFFKVALIAVVMSLFAVSCGGGEDDVQVESRIKNAAISNPGEAATEDQIEAECEFLADVRDESFDLDILDRFESLDYSDAKKLNKLDNDLNDRNSLRYDLSDLEDDLFDRRNDFSYDFRNGFQGYIQHLKDRIDLSDLRDLGVLRNDLSDLSDLFNRLKQYQKMEKWSAAKSPSVDRLKTYYEDGFRDDFGNNKGGTRYDVIKSAVAAFNESFEAMGYLYWNSPSWSKGLEIEPDEINSLDELVDYLDDLDVLDFKQLDLDLDILDLLALTAIGSRWDGKFERAAVVRDRIDQCAAASTTVPPAPTTVPPAPTTVPPAPTTVPPAPTTVPAVDDAVSDDSTESASVCFDPAVEQFREDLALFRVVQSGRNDQSLTEEQRQGHRDNYASAYDVKTKSAAAAIQVANERGFNLDNPDNLDESFLRKWDSTICE